MPRKRRDRRGLDLSEVGLLLILMSVLLTTAMLVVSSFGVPVEPSLAGPVSTFLLVGSGLMVEGRRRDKNGDG